MPGARPAAGNAGGALAGTYPTPGIGCPPLMAPSLWDEFIRTATTSVIGDWEWPRQDMGAGASCSQQVPTADTEVGIARITTAAVTGEGAFAAYGTAQWYAAPAEGVEYVAKLRCVDTTDIEVYSGWVQNPTARPEGATSNSFLGFKALRNGVNTNWLGVCRNGANETTLDLGVTADTTWRIFKVKRTSAGFVFYVLDHSGDYLTLNGATTVGTISQNIPTTNLMMAPLGVVPRSNNPKSAEIDFCGWGGTIKR